MHPNSPTAMLRWSMAPTVAGIGCGGLVQSLEAPVSNGPSPTTYSIPYVAPRLTNIISFSSNDASAVIDPVALKFICSLKPGTSPEVKAFDAHMSVGSSHPARNQRFLWVMQIWALDGQKLSSTPPVV